MLIPKLPLSLDTGGPAYQVPDLVLCDQLPLAGQSSVPIGEVWETNTSPANQSHAHRFVEPLFRPLITNKAPHLASASRRRRIASGWGLREASSAEASWVAATETPFGRIIAVLEEEKETTLRAGPGTTRAEGRVTEAERMARHSTTATTVWRSPREE